MDVADITPEQAGNEVEEATPHVDEALSDKTSCPICLEIIGNECTVVPCFHSFCFECITMWSQSSLLCPLCKQHFSEGLHALGKHVFKEPTTRQSWIRQTEEGDRSNTSWATQRSISRPSGRRRMEPRWGPQSRLDSDPATQSLLLESISKRAKVYSSNAHAKHVASNMYTKFRPFPSPAEFRVLSLGNPSLRSKIIHWIRRDLRVILGLQDVEIVVEYVMAVIEKHPIQTEDGIRLLKPYIRDQTEHFVHELVAFVRSGLTLDAYDAIAQYELNGVGAVDSENSARSSVVDQDIGRRTVDQDNAGRSRKRVHVETLIAEAGPSGTFETSESSSSIPLEPLVIRGIQIVGRASFQEQQ